MKILIFSWRGIGHPKAGGAEQVTFEYAKGWVKSGYDVTIFTSFYPGCQSLEVIKGVKFIRSGDEVLGVQIKAFFWYLISKEKNYDIVIDEFHGIPFFTPLYIGTKKLAFIHEVAGEVWKLNPWPKPFNLIPAILGPLSEKIIFRLLYSRTRFLTVSQSTKNDLISLGISNQSTTIIPNGVIVPKIDKKFKKSKITITYLGALSKDKGIEEALKVFGQLYNKVGKAYNFWIIGKGDEDYLNFLNSQVEKLGIKKQVKFWGFVSEKKKFELISKSHLLINPSIKEGWGLVVIEGAILGVPTVGFNSAGLRDSIINNQTGILCKHNSPTDMAEQVIKLLDNQRLYNRMCANAIKWSRKFNWKDSIKLSLSLLDNIKNEQ